MKTNTEGVEKAINKMIADYKTEIDKRNKEIDFYQNGIKKLSDTLVFLKGTAPSKRGGARPNAGRKKQNKEVPNKPEKDKIEKVKLKQKSKHKLKVPFIKWDSVVIPLLEKNKRPMSGDEIINKAYKGKHAETKKILRSRLSTALSYMKRIGKLKSFPRGNIQYYGLLNMTLA